MRIPVLRIIRNSISNLQKWAISNTNNSNSLSSVVLYDRTLLWLTFGLVTIGFVMITSASMPLGQRLSNDPFFLLGDPRFIFY